MELVNMNMEFSFIQKKNREFQIHIDQLNSKALVFFS